MSLQQAMSSFLTVTNVSAVGLSPSAAAVAFACAQGAATFGRLFWAWISDTVLRGERYILISGLTLLAAVAAVAVGSLGPSTQGLAIPAALLLGLSAAGWNGVHLAAIGEIGGLERAGSALGVSGTIIFAASAVTPGVFGLLAEHTSLATAWYTFAALALLGVIPPIWLQVTGRAPARA